MTEPTEEQLKEYSRTAFVGNECGTDEYREAQPEKGLMFVSQYMENFEALGMNNPLGGMPALNRTQGHNMKPKAEMLRLTTTWLDKMATVYEEVAEGKRDSWDAAYAGADELEPILALHHDLMWDLGSHPYDKDYRETIIEDYREDHA